MLIYALLSQFCIRYIKLKNHYLYVDNINLIIIIINMTEKSKEVKRTTVTLSNISMNLINELIGVFGNTPAAVISNIVDHFFYYGKFEELLKTLRAKKRELYPPDENELRKKIIDLLSGVEEIPFDEFIEDLELDRKYVIKNFHTWSKTFGIKRKGNMIIK